MPVGVCVLAWWANGVVINSMLFSAVFFGGENKSIAPLNMIRSYVCADKRKKKMSKCLRNRDGNSDGCGSFKEEELQRSFGV